MTMRYFTTAAAVLAFAAPLAAQAPVAAAPVPDATVSAPAARSLSPRAVDHIAGVRAVDASTAAVPAPAPVPQMQRRGTAMMVLGGAALLVGALVGGDAGTIVMVGGGIVGLVGLWNWLQ